MESSNREAATVSVPVDDLLKAPGIAGLCRSLVPGADFGRSVTHPRIQKSGLILTGHMVGAVPTRVQILGETEISFLEEMSVEERQRRMRDLFEMNLSLVVVTRGVQPPVELVKAATESRTAVVVSNARSSATIGVFHEELDRLLAPVVREHGVLVEVHGLGTLLRGPSGIGKSECALFLLERGGHRLVADDRVVLTRLPGRGLVGKPEPVLRHHLEVRGLGILNIRDLFGATSVVDEVGVDLVVELRPWGESEPYERLGIDDQMTEVLGVEVPILRVPVRPGRDMAVIIEIAARNQLLKREGIHGARAFTQRLDSRELEAGKESAETTKMKGNE